jgi:rhamnosyltransferase
MSKSVPQVAVLLAAYNGISFLEEQLDSIVQQEAVTVTIFINVDLSTDNSYQCCCDYAKIHPQVKVLPYGNKFGGAAANFYHLIKTVDFSAFDFVALADQDDIWLKNKLRTACNKLETENFDAYSSNVIAFWENGHELLIHKAQPQRQYDYLFEAAGPGCTYVMRTTPMLQFKELIQTHSLQVAQISLHDWFIYAFFRANELQWFIDPEPGLLYRQHLDNQVGIHKGWHAILKRFKLLHKGWCKQQVLNIADLVGNHSLNLHSRLTILKNIQQLRRHHRDRWILFFIALIGLY